MSKAKITLFPEGRKIVCQTRQTLKTCLENANYQFPNNCGGNGKCANCRVEIIGALPPATKAELSVFGEDNIFRMACQHKLSSDIGLIIPKQSGIIHQKRLTDFNIGGGGTGYGIAIDLGTTTVATYLADLNSGEIIEQESCLNPQIAYGGDVITRLSMASDESTSRILTRLVQECVSDSISRLTNRLHIDKSEINSIVIAGNTVMSEFWLGKITDSLGQLPFTSQLDGEGAMAFDSTLAGLSPSCKAMLCPVISGFIGGDTIAAIIAAGLDRFEKTNENCLLIDLGTNGEIVLGTQGKLTAVSTSAGPAFEGVGMSAGMAVQLGAITGFSSAGIPIVIGNCSAKGYCGSGYIEALDWLLSSKKMSRAGLLDEDETRERRWSPASLKNAPVYITQDDIRKFQLAKAAIATGIKMLLNKANLTESDLNRIILTGSFGNHINILSAMKLGLLPRSPLEVFQQIDNAAGRGALLCLNKKEYYEQAVSLQSRVAVLDIALDMDFQERFVDHINFPEP